MTGNAHAYPHERAREGVASPAPSAAASLIVFSLEPWDHVWRRNQYIVDGLLRDDDRLRVIFVEPARDVTYDLLSGRRVRRGAGTRVAEGYEGRLTLVQPTKWLPRLVGPMADRMLRRSVLRAVASLRTTPDVTWVNDPRWASALSMFPAPALYDMTDDWLAADRSEREHRRLVRDEALLMRECGAVVVCSVGLASSRRHIRPDLVTIPNAVDVDRYRRPASRPADLPVGPCAVYVGTLHEDRIDIDLIARTGAAMNAIGGACVLVGPNALTPENTQRLALSPGVRLLGVRPYEAVPGYLQHADVLVVPHAVTPFTDSLDPIKLYEYQAAGRPIVSTPVAGFRDSVRPGSLDVVAASEFPRVVAEAATRTDVPVVSVSVPDWQCRVRQFASVLSRVRTSASAERSHPAVAAHQPSTLTRSDGTP